MMKVICSVESLWQKNLLRPPQRKRCVQIANLSSYFSMSQFSNYQDLHHPDKLGENNHNMVYSAKKLNKKVQQVRAMCSCFLHCFL